MKFGQYDRVVYTGNKFKDLKAAVGIVDAAIQGEKDAYVVDFGSDAYVMPGYSLARYQPTSKEGPEILQVRRRRTEDDE